MADEMHLNGPNRGPLQMKKLLIFLAIAALPAAAQWRKFGERTQVEGFFGVGVVTPINPIARQLDTGWSLAGGVGVSSRYLGVMLDANYTDMGINHETLRILGVPHGDQKYWSLTVDPIFHVNRRGPVDFYLTGGGGLYSQINDLHHYHDNALYKLGVNGGAGFAFNVGGRHNRVKLFTEARLHHMFVGRSGASYIPVTFGVRF
jgi:hypothetical protein